MSEVIGYQDILDAARRIAGVLAPTPLVAPPDLAQALGRQVWLKLESLQRTGSFKSRGALNWVLTASDAELAPGLITVSAGNHALALAWAAAYRQVPVTVVMPEGSSPMKVEAGRALGARVILHGEINETLAYMEALRRERGLMLVHPYDDARVIAGQGTVGLEIQAQQPQADWVLVPVGGGGLVSGAALALKHQRPGVRVIGVETEGAPTLRRAWDAGRPVRLESARSLAPSLGAAIAGEKAYRLSRRYVDDIVLVPESALADAMRLCLRQARVFAEPGAVVGLAALICGAFKPPAEDRVVVVVTGGNTSVSELGELIGRGPAPPPGSTAGSDAMDLSG